MSDPKLHRTRWTVEEDEFLQGQWDGTQATAAVIAELLGRTVNATAQRHYELEWGTAAEPVEVKPELNDRPTRVTVRRTTVTEVTFDFDPERICPECRCEYSVSGACCC